MPFRTIERTLKYRIRRSLIRLSLPLAAVVAGIMWYGGFLHRLGIPWFEHVHGSVEFLPLYFLAIAILGIICEIDEFRKGVDRFDTIRTTDPACDAVVDTVLQALVAGDIMTLHGAFSSELRDRLPLIELAKVVHCTGPVPKSERLEFHAGEVDPKNPRRDWTDINMEVEGVWFDVGLYGPCGCYYDNVALCVTLTAPFQIVEFHYLD